jgi:N-acetylmuramoyl-L-alanine amidase
MGASTGAYVIHARFYNHLDTIVIDAGHGGKDPGAISCLGYPEKEINLRIARKIASILKKKRIRVIMTRTSDLFVDLDERAEIANHNGAGLFVSIHANSCNRTTARGYSVHIAPSAAKVSVQLAENIETNLSETGLTNRGLHRNNLRVLRQTRCPAALVEIGFVSNPAEAARLQQKDTQDRISQAIAKAIYQTLRNKAL